MGDIQSRKFQLTINNPDNLGLTEEIIKFKLDTLGLEYWCYSYEKGSCLHIHIFMYRNSPIRFSTLKNKFPGAHIEACRGSCQQNKDYVRKEGKYKDTDKSETNLQETFNEFGNMPEEKEEALSSKEQILNEIKSGKSSKEIIDKFPSEMYRIDDIDNLRMNYLYDEYSRKFRQVDVIYLYGKTGTGKTRYIHEIEDFSQIYRVTNYQNSGVKFDDYKGQNILVFEEFGSQIPIKEMLNYLDIYPISLPARYHNKIACYTKVYITSNESLDEQYKDVQKTNPESYNALLRRINRVVEMRDDGKLVYLKNEEPKEIVQKKGN